MVAVTAIAGLDENINVEDTTHPQGKFTRMFQRCTVSKSGNLDTILTSFIVFYWFFSIFCSSVSVSSNSSEELRQQIRRHKATRPPIEEEEPEKTNQDSQDSAATKEGQDKEEVSMGLSGNLLKDTNTVNGVVVRYSEPAEARKPKTKWRLYVFKGNEELPILYVHRQSAYLLGRDRKVADIPLDHPSCSKQHAVIQVCFEEYF